ncbi:sugar phosphate isomerase/epimerase family protein [Georgenia wutianyii]|uniref:sugar phosphate isomerase/epimerase family protein n=1 Tax=Georgenia wutianyii TaxID=2585135 RepID=UPI001CB752DB|nr:sugar phosphate isomerase/epimerase family protein [Georgenia wutianyii]
MSSLGAPELAVEDFLALASRHGCGAVELRCGDDQPVRVALEPANRSALRARLADHGLDLLAVASYVRVCEPGPEVASSLLRHIELANDLGAHGVRVFPGGTDQPAAEADARAVERLAEAAPAARAAGVRLLLETHDSHPRGADVARVVGPAAGDGDDIGVVWDLLHPWRHGEDVAETAAALGPWLDYVQVKDATGPPSAPVPALTGSGDMPLALMADTLDATGYTGWVSLEWERAWHPQVPPLDQALAATVRWLAER